MFKDLFNAKYILGANRYPWIDYVRGICIILVCFRHCFEGLKESGLPTSDHPFLEILNVCFYSFRMPLFFIISGLFVSRSLAKKSVNKYVADRFSIIFYPLLIWGSIQITLQLILKDYVNAKPAITDYLNLIIFPRNPANNQQFWYLNALFFVGALYAFLKVVCKFKITHQFILAIILYAIAGYWSYAGQSFYIFPDIFHHYIYFCIGDMIAGFIMKKDNEETIVAPRWLVISTIVFVAAQTLFTIVNIRHEEDNFINHKMAYLYLPISLVGCAFIIQLGFVLQRAGILKWLRVLGYHSLYIYLMHLMIIAAFRIILVRLLHIDNLYVVMTLAITAGLIIPILVYNMAVKIGAWWLFSLKKQEDMEVIRGRLKAAGS